MLEVARIRRLGSVGEVSAPAEELCGADFLQIWVVPPAAAACGGFPARPDPIVSTQRPDAQSTQRLPMRGDWILSTSTQRLPMREDRILSTQRVLSLEDWTLSTQRCVAQAEMNVST